MKKNRSKQAVALTYDQTIHEAPVVKAKGKGDIAENIIKEANKNKIPIYEDAALAEILNYIELDTAIPEELFMAVAEVFAFIYQIDQQAEK